jgi:hypothetical protein
MDWRVQYRDDNGDQLVMPPTSERAIEAAFTLIDHGHDVHGIGTVPLAVSINSEQIARI